MAHTVQLERMFDEVTFTKPGHEIAAKALIKIEQLRAKISEREAVITKLCEQHRLGAADLFALAQEQNESDYRKPAYVAPIRDVPAGVATALKKESQQVESERAQVRTLGLLTRNIEPSRAHELSFAELEYLDF